MHDVVNSAADAALVELLEVSPQVDAAVIVERDGGAVLAHAPASSARTSKQFGALCTKLLAAAERSRTELGREPVSQIEVATGDGHVFVVADATCIVAAVTDADPTVGLVFYDLKTALRTVREARPAPATITAGNGSAPVTVVSTDDRAGDEATAPSTTPAATSSGDDEGAPATGGDAGSQTPRWRRRKQ